MNKIFQTLGIILVVFGLLVNLPVQAQEKEKPVLLKTPLCFPSGLPGIDTSIKWMAENIDTLSKGTIRIKLYEPGKLIPGFQILSSVSKGAVNSGFSISGYWEGTIPGSSIFSAIPFGPEAPEFLAWIYSGNGRKLYQKMYDDAGYKVHVIPLGMLAPETGGWFLNPINGPDDLKGLNIRFYGLGGKVLSKLGVAVSLIPSSEIFPALEKGVIDGTEFSIPAIDALLGFHKIAKHNYFPGWHQQATLLELLINKTVWDRMSPYQQQVMETMAQAATLRTIAYTEAIQAQAMIDNKEKYGVTTHTFSDETLDALRGAWKAVSTELSAESPMFKEAYEDLTAFRTKYKIWSERGFFQRDVVQ